MKRNLKLRASLWDRFHAKVIPEPNSGCWLWLGGVNEHGYGIIGLGRRNQGVAKAHRVSYGLYKCDPVGGVVMHKCDNPACVNPEHLKLGTLADNSRDAVNKGRNFLPDNRGERATWSKLTEAQVLEIKTRKKPGRVYAKEFGVSKSAVFNIWRGVSWKAA